jgi:hypothetical protein
MDLARMSSCFRQRVIAFFLCRKLLNERLAKSMIQWTHSGFSVDATVRIPAGSSATRQALSQYIVRPPLSLQKLLVDEGRDAVVYRAPYSDYFRTDSKIFAPTAFLAEFLQHLPDSRNRLIRCYGLYSPRARGTPCPAGALARREGGRAYPTSFALPLRVGNATMRRCLPRTSASSTTTAACRHSSLVAPGLG